MGLPSASASHVGFLLEMGQWMDRFVIPQYMAFFLENMLINHEMLCPVSRHMALSDRESQLSDASSLLSNNVGKTIVNHPQNHQFHRWYKPSNMGFSINFLFYPDSFVAISWANSPISRASLISRPLAQGSWDAPRASLKADLSGSPGSDQV